MDFGGSSHMMETMEMRTSEATGCQYAAGMAER
jgi:hypothetical protein